MNIISNDRQLISIPQISAYAEDPRSYCHYKGIPRSTYNKKSLSIIARKNPLSSSLSRYSIYLIMLCLLLSAVCIFFWNAPEGIASIKIESEIIIYTSTGLFLLAMALWIVRSFFIKLALFKLCGVPTSSYHLKGTNLIWSKHSIKLTKNKLYGNPSTIFKEKNGKSVYVCQYNPRGFKGMPKVRERYQMLLFMGIAMDKFKTESVEGAIRYHDHLEFIKYDPIIYKKLLNLEVEYKEATQEWKAPDERPLFKRDDIF